MEPNQVKRLARGGSAAAVVAAILWLSAPCTTEAGINAWTTNGPEGGIINALAVDPKEPATLYASVSAVNGNFNSDGIINHGIFKSSDGGGTWISLTSELTPKILVIDPRTTTTLYAGFRYGGISKSTDGGRTWSAADSGLLDSVLYGLVIDPLNPDTLYSVAAYGVFKTTDGGRSWIAVFAGRPASVVVDPRTPGVVYASVNGHGVIRSADGGTTWSQGSGPVGSLSIDPLTPTTLYVASWCHGLFKSIDSGVSWSTTGLQGNRTCVGDLFIDPLAPANLYVHDLNAIYKSADGGATWNSLGAGGKPVRAFAIDPRTPATLYAGLEGDGVFKTTDAGGSWRAVSSGLSRPRVSALAVDP